MTLRTPRGTFFLFSPRENVDTDTMLRVMAGLQRCSMSFIPVVQKLCGRCKPPLRFFIPVMSMSHVFLFLSHSSRSPHTSLSLSFLVPQSTLSLSHTLAPRSPLPTSLVPPHLSPHSSLSSVPRSPLSIFLLGVNSHLDSTTLTGLTSVVPCSLLLSP